MAVGGSIGDFDVWLNGKLLAFNTDENVFGSYIRGILEGEESVDEKKEALQGILSEMTEDNISKLCQEILEKWNILNNDETDKKSNAEILEDVDAKLAKIMEKQAQPTATRNTNCSEEERRIRQAIISQYGQLSDEENDEENTNDGNVLKRNTNASSVAQAEKEKRERAKLESQKKKEKDKEDREKQKQMQQEKKEKRKPQKGERRR